MNLTVENELLSALMQLEATVKTMATANPKPSLLPLFARIDELAGKLPPGTDPSLLHYLHKKSYEKARLYLQGRDAENRLGHRRHCYAAWGRRLGGRPDFRRERLDCRRPMF